MTGNCGAISAFKAMKSVKVRNYAVEPGDRIEDAWSLAEFKSGGYHLKVHGPNGFYREFAGDEPAFLRLL